MRFVFLFPETLIAEPGMAFIGKEKFLVRCFGLPVVLRSNGKSGKGVIVAETYKDADEAIDFLLSANGADALTVEPFEKAK